MAVQEPGDGWRDQTSEVAGAVRDDLKRLEFLWFYLVQCVFSLSIRGSPTNHFYLAVCRVYCTTGCSLPLAYYEVGPLKVRASYENDVLVLVGKYTHQESAFVPLQRPDA